MDCVRFALFIIYPDLVYDMTFLALKPNKIERQLGCENRNFFDSHLDFFLLSQGGFSRKDSKACFWVKYLLSFDARTGGFVSEFDQFTNSDNSLRLNDCKAVELFKKEMMLESLARLPCRGLSF